MKKTSIVILTYNNLEYTKSCIESIYKYTKENTFEIIVVDNFSTDGTRSWLKKQNNLKVVFNSKNEGFPRGCNIGIENAYINNDILLLNNDTVVTTNWLTNLKKCLYSNNKIGAVGAICNNNENFQGIEVNYNTVYDMQEFAKKNNILDSSRWEEKVFLIGYCILIKREVINKIKFIDEKYSPGYIEDNDLSIRIINLGYKLMLCHDVFIYHHLGLSFRKNLDEFYHILNKNRNYFNKKWKFNTFSFDDIKISSFRLLDNPMKILDINCGIGCTVLSLKYNYKNIIVDGVEKNKNKRIIASKFTNVYKSITEISGKYDCILLGNYLENVVNPKKYLQNLKRYLDEDGYIIMDINNISSIKEIFSLINDNWYYTHLSKNYFTLSDIKRLLGECGYCECGIFSWYTNLDSNEIMLINDLNKYLLKDYSNVSYTLKFMLDKD